ncbi:reprolysin-like metallopeptidase [Stieleria maiorica]|uniref:reprolysin-like metallopeptidase n=1 Tax=Stieleria maiorica TaxID=2795974 RepID=UPI00142F3269|nr:M12 family metallo-peptidase [Stieleria maiorica]
MLEDRRLLAAGVGDDNFGIGTELRNYRLAVAATAEYTDFIGGQEAAFDAINDAVNELNAIFESELAIHLQLVSTTASVFVDAASDGYTNGNVGAMLNENTSRLNSIYGSAAYDIGHVFGTGSQGGRAGLGVVNTSGRGRGVSTSENPIGPTWVELVAHEIGHQFGAEHTFNASVVVAGSEAREASSAFEPASGSTLMGYPGIANDGDNLQEYPDPHFHAASFEQIEEFVSGVGAPNSTTPLMNAVPSVSAGADYVIPAGTPFELSASGSDPDDSDELTYTWDQLDTGGTQGLPVTDDGSRPLFRSFGPTTESSRVFPRLTDLVAGVDTSMIGEALPTTTRELNFRVTVRDGQGGVHSDDVRLNTVGTGAAFAITPSGSNWTGGVSETVTWDVAGTTTAAGHGIDADLVAIELSVDGGLTFPIVLSASTENDGSFTFVSPNIDVQQARVRVRPLDNVFFAISNTDIQITSSGSSPGILIQESGASTIVGEDGVVGSPVIDTYDIVRTTSTSGTTTVEISASEQAELSLDGINFSPTIHVDLAGTNPATVSVRGVDDAESEGIHAGLISHRVISSTDSNYAPAMIIRPVSVTIADDEWQPLIGVDFDEATGNSPTNWTKISEQFDGTYSDLIREDGIISPVGLTIEMADAALVFETIPNEPPLHSPRLDGIDGARLATQSFELTWSGLTPGIDYNLYVMTSEWFTTDNVMQQVEIRGGTDVPAFVQETRTIGNGLLINQALSDEKTPLESSAVIAQADANGEIAIIITNLSSLPNEDAILSGVAIQSRATDIPGYHVSQSADSTIVNESADQDTFAVVLSAEPIGDVVISLESTDAGEVVVTPSALTFNQSNWDQPRTVTVIGVDDAIADGDQTVGVTLAIDRLQTTDDRFDDLPDRQIRVLNQDDETGPLIGVDIGFDDPVPNNWTDVDSIFTVSGTDLIAEDGTTSDVDLTSSIFGSASSSSFSPPLTSIPQHTQSLANLDGYSVETTGETFNATWSDLIPGEQYRVYVFGLESRDGSFIQDVEFIGANSTSFTQTLVDGELFVNDAAGSSSNPLDLYARLITADPSGSIRVLVSPADGSAGIALAGLAIQRYERVNDSLSVLIQTSAISENGGTSTATVIRNNGSSGDLEVTLTSGDGSEANVPATVLIPDGSDRATFVVSAVDDQVFDGPQTIEITASATGLVDGVSVITILDDESIPRPLVGIDFDTGSETPTHWTPIGSRQTPTTEQNLKNETGAATDFDLTITGAGGSITSYTATPTPHTIPAHDQLLNDIAGQIYTDTNAVTFTWSDLNPQNTYEVYVFGLESFYSSIQQNVMITGAGPAISFLQDFNQNELSINDHIGSSMLPLSSYAVLVEPNSSGQIVIDVTPSGSTLDVSIGGLAIREIIVPETLDFGDAPSSTQSGFASSYPVLVSDNGARHNNIGATLGAARDSESVGVHSAASDGDDQTGTADDEDGITFAGPIVVSDEESMTATVDVELQNPDPNSNLLDAWIDFNRDGDWDDPGEQVIAGLQLGTTAGIRSVSFPVPQDTGANVETGSTYSRFRLSSQGRLSPTGLAADGEVEDHEVMIAHRPQLKTIAVGDGSEQRSTVSELVVTFDTEVLAAESAFELINRSTQAVITSLDISSVVVDRKTRVTITFDPGDSIVTMGGGAHSLDDGNYQLTINAAQITAVDSGLTMSENVIFGDEAVDAFFRFYGDSDGDRDVDGQDYGRFGAAFLKTLSEPGYRTEFDSDGDGDVDGQDYGRFGTRFLKTLPFA